MSVMPYHLREHAIVLLQEAWVGLGTETRYQYGTGTYGTGMY